MNYENKEESDQFVQSVVNKYKELEGKKNIFISVGNMRHCSVKGKTNSIFVTALGTEEMKRIKELCNIELEKVWQEEQTNHDFHFQLAYQKDKELDQLVKDFNENYMTSREGIDRIRDKQKRTVKKDKKAILKRRLKKLPKKIEKGKKFIALGMATILVAGGIYGVKKAPEYKEEAFNNSLNAVKATISENTGVPTDDITIWNDSSMTSSNSARSSYSVTIGDKTYEYESSIIDGETTVKQDTINNPELIEAISTVSSAKDSLPKAIEANRLVNKIKNNEIDLSIGEQEKNIDNGFEIGD